MGIWDQLGHFIGKAADISEDALTEAAKRMAQAAQELKAGKKRFDQAYSERKNAYHSAQHKKSTATLPPHSSSRANAELTTNQERFCLQDGCWERTAFGVDFCKSHQGIREEPHPPEKESPLRASPFVNSLCTWQGCTKLAICGGYCVHHVRERLDFIERHCGSKRKHRTEGAAILHKAEMESIDRTEYNVYQCQVCSAFHIGHAND
ncbi:MAG: hypothetical protein ABI286_10915 [Edaphobacter sp.]